MPFGLKKAGCKYQRAMQEAFCTQISENMEVCIDDLVVKSKRKEDLIPDLVQTFQNLRKYKIMLNPMKCVFGIEAGKILGFMVSYRGIEANTKKVKAIIDMKSPTNVREVQKLAGSMVSLSRFISRLRDRGLPFFK